MKKILMQTEHNGEWFEIWNTAEENLELAWDEIDDKPTEGGFITFDKNEIMAVNGGFNA